MNKMKWIGQNILIINNLIALCTFYFYKDYFNQQKTNNVIIFSCIVLMISFILISQGYELYQISGSKVRSYVVASELATEHKNIFGGNIRLAGYAEDPNYASIFWVIGIIAVLKNQKNKLSKIALIMSFLICLGYSCSKTILFSFLIGILYFFLQKLFFKKGYQKIINFITVISCISMCLVLPHISILTSLATMNTRFRMWNLANILFLKSPLIGNGIDSFKSYINSYYNGGWYVQPHSTYWQLLSESGIIGLIIFTTLIINLLNKKSNKYTKFLLLIYIIFAINFETIQLQLFIYIVYISFLENGGYKNDPKSVILS